MLTAVTLGIAVLICGSLAIVTDRPGPPRWHYLFKPLTTILILLLAVLGPADALPGSRLLIALGLAASLIGDVWLMLPDRFAAGLASFALAHACYITAFGGELTACPSLLSYLPYLAFATALCALVWRAAYAMRLPVAVYALLIAAMAWLAGARWIQAGTTPTLLGWIGALLFVASDSFLALNRFRRPIPHAELWVLSTYYVGQFLIALSA